LKFESGRNILSGTILSQAEPKWAKFGEIQASRAESQNRGHNYSATVVCAGTAGGNCDHLDCHRGPFLVVVMDIQTCVVHLSDE
jgi:hypothetical protein